MFCVTEAEAAMIRTSLEQRGELSAAVELRRLFRGIGSNEVARECVRAIAGWELRQGSGNVARTVAITPLRSTSR